MTISFDGAQGTQDRQRPFASGDGTFAAVLETLEYLDRCGFDYGIRMTALGPWQGRLVHDVEFICEETGCRRIQVEPALKSPRGEYRSPTLDESSDFAAGFMEAFVLAGRRGRRLVYSGARPWLLTSSFCSAPFGSLVVTPSGDLVTCYEVTYSQHPLASMCTIGRIESGQVIVDDEKRRLVLSDLAARREACRDCFCYWHCAGDCHVKTFYPGADADPEESARCQTNRSITAQMLLWHIADSGDGVWRGDKKRRHDPGLSGEEEGA
jgi:radical SAM protein with 4Fe4S-binding SPASM domain